MMYHVHPESHWVLTEQDLEAVRLYIEKSRWYLVFGGSDLHAESNSAYENIPQQLKVK